MDPAAVLSVLVKAEGIAETHRKVEQLDRRMQATADSVDRDARKIEGSFGRVATQVDKTTSTVRAADREWRKFASAPERVGSSLRAAGAGGDDGGRGIRRFVDSFGDLPGRIYLSTRLLGALSNILLTIAPVAVGAGAQIFAVVSALGPLIGLAAGGAGALMALAQGFGVLKLATSGIGGALKEYLALESGAGAQAIKSAGQQRAAAQQIAAAQEQVKAAKQRVADATRSLDEAERTARIVSGELSQARVEAARRLEDMRASLASATNAEQRATLALADARRNLQELVTVDVDKLAEAHERASDAAWNEQRAVRALEQARADLAKLLGGTDPRDLADAQEAVSDAQRAEQRATLDLERVRSRADATLRSSTATDQEKREAALDLADAEDALGDATQRRKDAEEELRKLQAGPTDQEKAEALQKVADAQRDVEKAQRATAQATRDINDLQKGADPVEVAKALQAIRDAELELSEAQRSRKRAATDLLEAERLGIERSDEVVAARERIRDANRAVADAERDLRAAQGDVAKAMQGVTNAQLDARDSAAAAAIQAGNLTKEFDKLPPAAQAFVQKLASLKPKLDELRATAASGLLPGVSSGLDKAMGSFDAVNTVVGQTSRELGQVADAAGALVGSAGFGRDIETIGGRNAKILGTLGHAALNLVDALRHVLVAAGPLTTWMANVALKWSESAKAAAETGRETGRLADFFDKTRERAQLLGSILANLARGLFGLGKGADATGEGILRRLDEITERFADWANSTSGQNQIADFFQRADAAMRKLGPALGQIIKAFTSFAMNVLPAYARVISFLGPALDELITLFIAWKIAATGAAIATGIYTVASKAQIVVTKAWAAAQWLLNAALAGNPIVLVVAALVALAAAIFVAYQKSEWFRGVVDKVWGALKTAASAVAGFVTDLNGMPAKLQAAGHAILHGIVDGIKALPGLILDAAKWLAGAWLDAVKAVASAFIDVGGWVLGRVVEGVKGLPGVVADAVKWLASTFWTLITAAPAAFVDIGKWILSRVVEGFKIVGQALMSVAGWLWNRIGDLVRAAPGAYLEVGKWILNRVVEGFKIVGEALTSLPGWLFNRIGELVRAAPGAMIDLGKWVLNRVVEGFKTITELLGSIGGWLFNRVEEFIGSRLKDFVGVGKTIIGWIADGFKSGVNAVIDFVNVIIEAINQIPEVNIPKVKKLAQGGTHGGKPEGGIGNQGRRAQGFAHGGAYARTQGLVTSPITLMGEEAPRYPEYVIPTNPAYRGRAQKLAMQAAQAVGLARGGAWQAFAEGGVFKGRVSVFGPPLEPAGTTASGVSSAEPGIALYNRSTLGKVFNVVIGDKFAMLRQTDIGPAPWTGRVIDVTGAGARKMGFNPHRFPTDSIGTAYLPKHEGGPIATGPGSLIGAVGDLLFGGLGVDDVTKLFPDPSKTLPGWLRGTGRWMIDKATGWVKRKLGDGGDLPQGVAGNVQKAIELAMSMGHPHPTHGQLTGGRHAKGSLHYQGRAVDFGDAGQTVEKMKRLFMALVQKFGKHLNELFYDKMPWYIDNHRKVSGQFGDHGDHIHAGFRKGGLYGGVLGSYQQGVDFVPQTGPYLLHRGERVLTREENAERRANGSQGPLVHIEHFHGEGMDERTVAAHLAWLYEQAVA